MPDRIIIKNTTSEANLGNIQPEDVLNGEMLLVRETDKESLYCKNTNNEISKIHRITNCGGFPSKLTYDAVDLGLPSGLLWADRNIGAATEEDAGLYFQWGDIVGYTSEQVGKDKQFSNNWSDYEYGTIPDFTKYNSSDGLTTLEASDDAATQIMSSDWRMPTIEELTELIDDTDIYIILTDDSEVQATHNSSRYFKFSIQDAIKGVKFYRKDNHSKYIFIPASGDAYDSSVHLTGAEGFLWSSSLSTAFDYDSSFLSFNARTGSGGIGSNYRRYGKPIRAVKPQE